MIVGASKKVANEYWTIVGASKKVVNDYWTIAGASPRVSRWTDPTG